MTAHAVIKRVSGGRPFVLTSVVRAMVESGALESGPRGWTIDPHSLAALIASGESANLVLHRRLDRLPDEILGLLSAGAVLGRHVSVTEAAELASIEPERADGDRGGGSPRRPDLADGGAGSILVRARQGPRGRAGTAERSEAQRTAPRGGRARSPRASPTTSTTSRTTSIRQGLPNERSRRRSKPRPWRGIVRRWRAPR